MKNDLEQLLINLEPAIQQKCIQIKKSKEQKRQNKIFSFLCFSFITIPSILLLLNIRLIYFIVGVILVILFRLFIKLPDILKKNLEGICYESMD